MEAGSSTGKEREVLATIESSIGGRYVYKAQLTLLVLDEQLQCHWEAGNDRDRYTVAVKKDTLMVGHIP